MCAVLSCRNYWHVSPYDLRKESIVPDVQRFGLDTEFCNVNTTLDVDRKDVKVSLFVNEVSKIHHHRFCFLDNSSKQFFTYHLYVLSFLLEELLLLSFLLSVFSFSSCCECLVFSKNLDSTSMFSFSKFSASCLFMLIILAISVAVCSTCASL